MNKLYIVLGFIFFLFVTGLIALKFIFSASMIDHFSFAVKDFDKSSKFYDETLKILGYGRVKELNLENGAKLIAYGDKGSPFFWISNGGYIETEEIGNAKGLHLAFCGKSVEQINKWYEKCIELGGKDNGKPGPRKEYHPGYYGAFIIDPSGWRIEACMHMHRGK